MKALLPEAMADRHDGHLLFVGTRQSAEQWRGTEDVVECASAKYRTHLIVAFGAAQIEAVEGVAREPVEHGRLLLPVADVRERCRVAGGGSADGRGPHGDEARGIAIRQRPQQHRVHDAEDGRVRADA